jgi:sugar phosphate isomerase/epimerase
MTCADRSVLCSTAQALDWCSALGEGVGVALDVYHIWWDPDVLAQIARARGRILGFHVCDWLKETRDLVTDRGMMGDGVIDIAGLRTAVDAAGYDGPIEVEIFSSRDWWTRDPDEVLAVMKARFERCV